jgi:hypothetical protein
MKKIFVIVLMITLTTAAYAGAIVINGVGVSLLQDKIYKKIETKDVPVPVLKEITEKYPNYTITQAAVSDDKEYKLSITDAKQPVTVFYTATGEFVKEQK